MENWFEILCTTVKKEIFIIRYTVCKNRNIYNLGLEFRNVVSTAKVVLTVQNGNL